MGEARLELADIERAIASSDPQLGDMLVRYLDQGDPDPGHGDLAGGDDFDDDTPYIDVPASAVTLDRLTTAVGSRGLAGKTPTERKLARAEAFTAAEASTFAPPRLRLGKMLVAVYERGDEAGRAALIDVFARGKMQWGVWQAAKTVYKRAEERHDLAMFGVLAYRFDAFAATDHAEIGAGTMTYLRRRAWRYLRQLGNTVPDVYPAFVVEVLRHYPSGHGRSAASWVAAHIWGHKTLVGARGSASFGLPGGVDVMAVRAFPDAWKVSPAPLLRLLDAAVNDIVCAFAILSLRADHPLTLRAVEPAWLARLGRRPVAVIHSFVVSLLKDSPELHQSRLRELGLHDVVMGFLRSPAADARAYALDYAAAHGDLAIDELVELIETGASDVKRFAAARLEAIAPSEIGLVRLLRLLGIDAAPWVAASLAQGFSPKQIDAETFVEVASRGVQPLHALIKWFTDANAAIPAGHWTTLTDDRRFAPDVHAMRQTVAMAMTELGKRTASEIGVPWIQRSLENRARTDAVARWLDTGMLTGPDLDVDWLKGLVGKSRLKGIALKLLGDRRRVAPAHVGLAWLLELARSSDSQLATFSQRMLLESFEPEDFAERTLASRDQDGSRDRPAGVQRLWELATGKKQPEPVRTFAATYLKAHHPDLGPRSPEARTLGIQPRLDHDAYPLTTLRPFLADDRADVRRLAVAIAGEEIVRWDEPELVYTLAGSPHREARALGAELLLGVLASAAPAGRRVPETWLDGRRMFQLAESAHKASREVALTLIRRLYDRLGGAERLAWLMESPDRDVRLFAVRLFWDRHRPKPWPDDFAPRKATGAAIGTQRFADLAALRQFARVVLFGLPPGRVGERDPIVAGAPAPERALPASVAKKRLIESMRDLGLDDVEFARAIAPVLGEFTSSTAKGEWQASLQALTALRARHRDLEVA